MNAKQEVIQSRPTQSLRMNPSYKGIFQRDEPSIERLRTSITEHGVLVPLIIKADGTIIDGHRRQRAALGIGLEFVPVQIVESEEEFQPRRIRKPHFNL